MSDQLMFIGGEWTDAADGQSMDVINPATGLSHTSVPKGGAQDAERAINTAYDTFYSKSWAKVTNRDRGRILIKAGEYIREHLEEIAKLESMDMGKIYSDSLSDVAEAAFIFEYYGGYATKIQGEIPPMSDGGMALIVKEPAGVCVAITPWNYPIVMASQKVAPAIAAGCTSILKPASDSPSSSLWLAKALEYAGLPKGVLSVLTGPGSSIGATLVKSPKVDVVSLTGSTEVGKWIMKEAADTLKRVTLELGGKSPNIFYADADFQAAVEGSCNGVFWNSGEICSAGTRVFVEQSIYDDALSAMVEIAENRVVGDPLDAETEMGPVVSAKQKETIDHYIEIGKKETRLAGEGKTPEDDKYSGGYWVAPTIFADATNDMVISREEIFGPVMTVIPFKEVEEVIDMANDNPYGLAAAVWTRDIKKGLNTAKALRAGNVWINDTQPAPSEGMWGGYKQSGFGRELGPWGLDDYLEAKQIYINLDEGGDEE